MNKANQYISSLLLLILTMAIVPLESFHHHEEEHIACTEKDTHVEEPLFECDLCDFVIPVFDQQKNQFDLNPQEFTYNFLQAEVANFNISLYQIPEYRGPPSMA